MEKKVLELFCLKSGYCGDYLFVIFMFLNFMCGVIMVFMKGIIVCFFEILFVCWRSL